MKKIKLFVIITLLLTSSITAFANDYALMNTYPLLDEMKSAKKQQTVLKKIYTTIVEHKYNSQEQLTNLKSQFTTILDSITKGTKVTIIKNKIEELKVQWEEDNHLLDSAINSEMYQKEALHTLSKLSDKLNLINKLYAQSYARYKQNSIMKSLVSSYMKRQKISEQRYALNTVK